MPSEPLAKEKKEPYLDPKIANHPNNFLRTRPMQKQASNPAETSNDQQKDETSSKMNSLLTGKDKPVTLKINLVMDKSKTQMYHHNRRISQGIPSQKGGGNADETLLPIDIS